MEALPGMTEAEIRGRLFPDYGGEDAGIREMPDYGYVDKELMKHGVNLKLLWTEYCAECRQREKMPLMYSQYCNHYRKYRERSRATMHIPRKPGEQAEVDWAGTPAHITDRDTGDLIAAYVFVGVLSYSLYAYAEAFMKRDMESWINAHVNMLSHFGGTTKMIVPDNLKTGVDRTDWYTPQINRTYQEMAEHYDLAIIPARVRRPQDKPGVEGSVKVVTTWITAALRNEKFFSLKELNDTIELKLRELNDRPFQKKEGSRSEMFSRQEKSFLHPLPATRYELATWKHATVQFNYHVSVDSMQYSVPYEYLRHKVDVRVTRDIVEVFYGEMRICSHKRLYGHPSQYSTVPLHMPKDHREYMEWNGDRFIKWAEKAGVNTTTVVRAIFASQKIEQQGYRSCMGLLKLGDRHGVDRLESACERALSFTPRPTYKIVKNILASGQDRIADEDMKHDEDASANEFGFTRGAGYYGGKKND
jgi:transposase